MKFKFNITLTEQDYIEYNIFWMTKSPYGKRTMLLTRLTMIVISLLIAINVLISGEFSGYAIIEAAVYILLLGMLQLALNPFLASTTKMHLKSLKRKGKMAYSPTSEIEFCDEKFIETTPENKSEYAYSAVERISIIRGRKIYIHLNNTSAYLMPMSSFASKEQFVEFMSFIRTKCQRIDVYDGK